MDEEPMRVDVSGDLNVSESDLEDIKEEFREYHPGKSGMLIVGWVGPEDD